MNIFVGTKDNPQTKVQEAETTKFLFGHKKTIIYCVNAVNCKIKISTFGKQILLTVHVKR